MEAPSRGTPLTRLEHSPHCSAQSLAICRTEGETMRTLMIVAATAALMPGIAGAQVRNDVAYCRQLAATYEYYIGRSEKSAFDDLRRGSLDGQVAASQCQSSTPDAIRVLELKLRNGKIDLPPRS